jgi:hypothetical protein
MKALSSRLKKRAQAEYKQRIERLDNAIRSQSHRVQQQNTRLPVTCASQRQKYAGQPQVDHRSTTVAIMWIRQGGKELSFA